MIGKSISSLFLAGILVLFCCRTGMGQGFSGAPGAGGPQPPVGQRRVLTRQFDRNRNGRLDRAERRSARLFLKREMEAFALQYGGGPFGGGFPGFNRPAIRTPMRGLKVKPGIAKVYRNASLYDANVLRTLFLDFENPDWEAELQEFHGTDVLLPATLTVDGRRYPNVGVRFRGNTSYYMVPAGYKRSLDVKLDLGDKKQKLYGYKSLNLINNHGDPSLMASVLYSRLARDYTAAPKANFVQVVINGESWGIYTNIQQFDKTFLKENYGDTKGSRWKVPGNPFGGGGLNYLGEDMAVYKSHYELKQGGAKAWKRLITLCRLLSKTPPDRLEAILKPILDVDSTLWFLAADMVVLNLDGYWLRASDYNLYMDDKGIFHVSPYDMNASFYSDRWPVFGPPPGGFGGPPEGGFGSPPPGGFGGPPAGGPGMGFQMAGVQTDPLTAIDADKALRCRLLAVPALRSRYLHHVQAIARKWLDWKTLGPLVAGYRALIAAEVKRDTRKLASYEEFLQATSDKAETSAAGGEWPGQMNLRAFAEKRREYLLNYVENGTVALKRPATGL
ncbi:MAG: CotH kinase family protein [Armatimonadetes bacterium]|nr:CotH kinase family protein [Armatimonadota bacterium]